MAPRKPALSPLKLQHYSNSSQKSDLQIQEDIWVPIFSHLVPAVGINRVARCSVWLIFVQTWIIYASSKEEEIHFSAKSSCQDSNIEVPFELNLLVLIPSSLNDTV